MKKFVVVDTNILMGDTERIVEKFEECNFIICSIVLEELDNLKMSDNGEKAFNARQGLKFIDEHKDKFEYVVNDKIVSLKLEEGYDVDKNDNRILDACARLNASIMSDDRAVRLKAKNLGIDIFDVCIDEEKKEKYTGFKEIVVSDEELAKFYQNKENKYDLEINEYLIIKNNKSEVVDKYRWTANGFEHITIKKNRSTAIGEIKAFDVHQQCVLDSLNNNKITMIRGKAGSGKTLIALSHLFSQLEKHKIDKIIIFCNPLATYGSARLGFYPGTKDDKLLDSQVGNILSSKLGEKIAVEMLINQGKLVLLPMSDIRGYDTTNMNAGILIIEAQNMDVSLMKLALQRVGEDCQLIIDGDYTTQLDDVKFRINNGMKRVSEVFRGHDFYGEVELQNIYRSRIAEVADLL